MTKNTITNTLLIGGTATTISALHYAAFNHYVNSAAKVFENKGVRLLSPYGYILEGITGMRREGSFFRTTVFKEIPKDMYVQDTYPIKSNIAKSYRKMWGRLTVILGATTLLMTAICAYQNRK